MLTVGPTFGGALYDVTDGHEAPYLVIAGLIGLELSEQLI